jgi:hypothetical protein
VVIVDTKEGFLIPKKSHFALGYSGKCFYRSHVFAIVFLFKFVQPTPPAVRQVNAVIVELQIKKGFLIPNRSYSCRLTS